MKSWEGALLISGGVFGCLGLALAASSTAKERAKLALEAEPEWRVTADRLVSVVIPTLQEENYLPNLLTSIKHQSYSPIEVVVVDGSPLQSYLRTEEICRSFGARILHRPDLNLPASRNEGAKQARGEILVFSDADNILDRYCVEHLVGRLLEGYALSHPVESIYDDGIYGAFVTIFRDWLKPNHWTSRCVAIWRNAFFAVGGYNPSYDPNKGFREDLQLGLDVIARFGEESIRLVGDALIASSMRRERASGIFAGWVARGVRDGVVIDHQA
jgi:glycosyltransferase involved in cell wall biosynthesis